MELLFGLNSLNKSCYQHQVSRTVLMVIDALRTDFIQNQQNTSMKYLNKMINDGAACSINLNVEVPTVTMPRIKVILSFPVNLVDIYAVFLIKTGYDDGDGAEFHRRGVKFG